MKTVQFCPVFGGQLCRCVTTGQLHVCIRACHGCDNDNVVMELYSRVFKFHVIIESGVYNFIFQKWIRFIHCLYCLNI